MKSCYKKEPLNEVDGIPVFSTEDRYIDNYNKISLDHVKEITKDSENPWIPEQMWDLMESETAELVLKKLNSETSEKIKMLDVGVGLGRLLSKISSSSVNDLELYGMDISKQYLKIAKDKNIECALAKIEDMPYKNEYFDIVTCTDVLEHVVDLNACLSNIINVVKKNGILVVRVPNREDLSAYLDESYPYNLSHLRDFNEYSLVLLFSKIFNLEVLEIKNGLYMENYPLMRYRLPVKGYNFLITQYLHVLNKISVNKYHKYVRKLYHSTEINIVLRKK